MVMKLLIIKSVNEIYHRHHHHHRHHHRHHRHRRRHRHRHRRLIIKCFLG